MIIPIDIKQEYKTFTVEEIFEALKKNGLTHLRGQWISAPDQKVVGACVLGQAAYNLGVPANGDYEPKQGYGNLYEELVNFEVTESPWLNEEFYKGSSYWDSSIDAPFEGAEESNVADLIIFWNDRREYKVGDNGMFIATGEWKLKTYDDVVNMAREIMEPFFSNEVKLPHYDY